jgi:hypothetical protein
MHEDLRERCAARGRVNAKGPVDDRAFWFVGA